MRTLCLQFASIGRLGISVLLLVLGLRGYGANLVSNPSFEDGHNFGCAVFFSGQTFGGWRVDRANVDVVFPGACSSPFPLWVGSEGQSSLDLSGSGLTQPFNGSISQDVPTIPGRRYALRFALAGNVYGGPPIKTLEVLWNSIPAGTFRFDTTGKAPNNMGWRLQTLVLSAFAERSVLTFRTPDSSGYGPVIDQVSLDVAGENLVQNGSFEENHDFNCAVFGTGLMIGAWTVDRASVDVLFPGWCGTTSTIWVGPEGRASLDLGGSGAPPFNGSVSQMISTDPGRQYVLRFALGGNLYGGSSTKPLRVLWNSAEVRSIVFDTSASTALDMKWRYFEIPVSATGATSRLTFETSDTSGYGPVIDDVSLLPVTQSDLTIRVSHVDLCWSTETNRLYQVQYSSPLTTNGWVPIDGQWLSGNGERLCTNTAAGEQQRFFRIISTNVIVQP
jgi:hypothetical protein